MSHWNRLDILGDNSLADSAIGFLKGQSLTLNSFYDFVRFWDAYVIYDTYYAERLPAKDVHVSQADFFDLHRDISEFVLDLTYSRQEEENRWRFAEDVLTSPGYVFYLAREGLPASLSQIGEDQYLSARYEYSRAEVKPDILERVESAILKENPDQRLVYLVPHLIRSHLNVYSQAKRAVEARYVTLREVLIDNVRLYAEGAFHIAKPAESTNLAFPEVRRASQEALNELESRLKNIVAIAHPVYLALEKVEEKNGDTEDLIMEMQDMRDYLSDFRTAINQLPEDLSMLNQVNEILRGFEVEFGKGRDSFSRVREWLTTWPIFSLAFGALGIALRVSPYEAVITGGASDVAYHLFLEVEKKISEKKYGLSAFKEVLGRGAKAKGSEQQEVSRAFSMARHIVKKGKRP